MSDTCTLVLTIGVSRGVVGVIASPTFVGGKRNLTQAHWVSAGALKIRRCRTAIIVSLRKNPLAPALFYHTIINCVPYRRIAK